MRPLRSLLLAAALCVAACAPAVPIEVTNAWIRPPVPGTAVAAGYFDIVNNRSTPVALISARCAAAPTIEIHKTTRDGDLMRMRRLGSVELPAGERVTFAEGGLHLMLLHFTGVTTPSVPVTLVFADGSELTVPFELRSLTGANAP